MCIDSRDRLPSTLVHGDLHADNIARTGRGYVLFDWTDACVGHPFVDFVTFVYNFGPTSNDPAAREATQSLLGRVERCRAARRSDRVVRAGGAARYDASRRHVSRGLRVGGHGGPSDPDEQAEELMSAVGRLISR